MGKLKHRLLSMVSCVLAFVILANGVSAEEIVDGVHREVVLATSFPLELEVICPTKDEETSPEDTMSSSDIPNEDISFLPEEASESNSPAEDFSLETDIDPQPTDLLNEDIQVVFSLKNDFAIYEEFRVEVFDPTMHHHLLMEQKGRSSKITLSDLIENELYPMVIRLYGEDHERTYEGKFTLSDGEAIVTSYTELETIEHLDNASVEQINGLTSEEYDALFEDMDLPSFISEDVAQEAGHIQRLPDYAESMDTIGFRNIDGSKTLYVFSSPVRYRDKMGQVKDGDPDIQVATSVMREEGYQYYNDFGTLEAYFPDAMTDQKGVLLKTESQTVEFGFGVAEESNLFQQAATAISSFFTNENQATIMEQDRLQSISYKRAVRHENGVEAIPTLSGARQTMELSAMPEGGIVSFWVDTADLVALPNESDEKRQTIEFVAPASGKTALTVGNVELRDAYNGMNEENNTHFSVQNTVRVAEQNGTRTLVEISLDQDMLASPMTVYPLKVTVEAAFVSETKTGEVVAQDSETSVAEASAANSFSVASTATGSTEVGSDKFQDRTVYVDGTRGNPGDQYLIVGPNGTYFDSTSQTNKPREGISFMKYDLSGLSVDPADIEQVELQVYEGSGSYNTVRVDLKLVMSDWNEDTVSSDQRFEINEYYTGNDCVYISQSGTKNFNITTMMTSHLIYEQRKPGGLPNYGFALRTNSTTSRKDFCSSEHSTLSFRPRLVIQYRDPCPPSSIGLSTDKAYWIRPYNTNLYLCQDDWRDPEKTRIYGATGNPYTGENIGDLQKESLYWKISYDAASDEYSIIPMNSQHTMLEVLSTSTGEVGLCDEEYSYRASKWRIEPAAGGGYRILSKAFSYTRGLNGILGEDAKVRSTYSFPCVWEFIPVECPGVYGTSFGDLFVGGHPVQFVDGGTGYPHYRCMACHKNFKTAEQEDKDILTDPEYATVVALLRAVTLGGYTGDTLYVEAALRAIDIIRSNHGMAYQSSDLFGEYKSPYKYRDLEPKVNITINTKTVNQAVDFLGPIILGDAMDYPYSLISPAISFALNLVEGSLTFSDFLSLTSLIPTFIEKMKRIPETAKYCASVINSILLVHIFIDLAKYPFYDHAYKVKIRFLTECDSFTFNADYRYDYKNDVHIKHESLTPFNNSGSFKFNWLTYTEEAIVQYNNQLNHVTES